MNRLEPRSRGLTLIELLVVLTIVTLLLAVVPPFFAAGMTSASLKGAARQMASSLRYTRSMAVTREQEMVLALDVDNNSYHVIGSPRAVSVPANLRLSLVTAASERPGAGQGMIRFFPDGSSTGGRITVAHGERSYFVDIDWLSGRVTLID